MACLALFFVLLFSKLCFQKPSFRLTNTIKHVYFVYKNKKIKKPKTPHKNRLITKISLEFFMNCLIYALGFHK